MLKVTVENAHLISAGMWSFSLPPHQVRMFGKCENAIGQRSLILLTAAEFSPSSGSLVFSLEDATALNIGNSTEAVAILSPPSGPNLDGDLAPTDTMLSRGDREFLQLCKLELPENMYLTARALLARVRERSPGELKRGQSRNFSDTPDNFWYVIVQPRVEQLSITVRGPVDLFDGVTQLPVKDDRGNTLFKISNEQEVEAALQLIFRAKRKL